MDMITDCQNKIRMLARKVQLIFSTGRTSTLVDDSGVIRKVQIQLGPSQTRDGTPVMQHYGFASNMPPNCDAIFYALNGDRSVGVILGSNHQSYTIKNLGNGAVALYDMFGNRVVLDSTGINSTDFTGNLVSMTAAGVKISSPVAIEMDAPLIRIHAANILKQDAGGTGSTIVPAAITSYTQGVTTTVVPPNPPEIP
jgi:phage gp45-like